MYGVFISSAPPGERLGLPLPPTKKVNPKGTTQNCDSKFLGIQFNARSMPQKLNPSWKDGSVRRTLAT